MVLWSLPVPDKRLRWILLAPLVAVSFAAVPIFLFEPRGFHALNSQCPSCASSSRRPVLQLLVRCCLQERLAKSVSGARAVLSVRALARDRALARSILCALAGAQLRGISFL